MRFPFIVWIEIVSSQKVQIEINQIGNIQMSRDNILVELIKKRFIQLYRQLIIFKLFLSRCDSFQSL